MRQQPTSYREAYGCRCINPAAVATEPIAALGGDVTIDHCPGVLVDTPYIAWVYSRMAAAELGYSLGPVDDAPVPEVESMIQLRRIRRTVAALAARGE